MSRIKRLDQRHISEPTERSLFESFLRTTRGPPPFIRVSRPYPVKSPRNPDNRSNPRNIRSCFFSGASVCRRKGILHRLYLELACLCHRERFFCTRDYCSPRSSHTSPSICESYQFGRPGKASYDLPDPVFRLYRDM